MKILFGTYPWAYDTPGGGEQQLLDYKKYLEINNISTELYNQWFSLSNDYDVFHFFSVMPGSLSFIDYIKKRLKKPLVISPNFWVDIEGWKKNGTYEEIKSILWLADKIIVNSFIEKEYLVRTMQIDPSHIGIVHNMYNNIFLDRVSSTLFKEKYDIDSKFILNVANIEPRKNQFVFLNVLKDFPEYKLVTIGSIRENWYYDACKDVAKEQFIHIERLNNDDPLLRSAYAGCEFFAMPSLLETPSISALEASVSGAKVLLTKLGSTKEYFNDFVEYINPYDVKDIKEGIVAILNREKDKKLFEHIKNNFSSNKVINQLKEVYSTLTKKKLEIVFPMAIHQFHSGSAYGDAVTNGMLYTKKILQELGFESTIYVEHVAPELENEIEHYLNYESSEENILLLHHSMGHDLDEWISELKDKIILVYHNITPETFFEEKSIFYAYSLKGRRQLDLLKKKSIAAIGDSQLNVDELLSRGFDENRVKVIPLLLDVDKIISHHWDYKLYDKNSDTFNIIFIGRVADNKCQHEIIEIYKLFRQKTNLKTKCFIVGGLSKDNYEASLYELIKEYSLENEVIVTDKVSSEDLYAYYRLADIFLCMSEHEGFGVPLVESMVFDIPIIAYNSSNVENTLNGGGILVTKKDFDNIADIVHKISTNRTYRREIIYSQREALKIYENNYIKLELINFLDLLGIEVDHYMIPDKNNNKPKYQFEGPFDSSYSLAIVNREMARGMNRMHNGEVSLFSTEGVGDFKPNKAFFKEMDDVISMNQKAQKAVRSDVLLRNLYPPRVRDMRGLINLMNSYGWEESSFPKKYIDNFNQYLDALLVTSKYVQKVMKDNGLTIPAPVVGDGVDHLLNLEPKKYTLNTTKKFKFLHVSSCFPRKGIDVLLEAYCSSFSYEDNVCLVIKTFPNPHNDIEEQIMKKQNEDAKCPEIELINKDLEDGYIVGLYKSCDCLVAPSRGEGYGMPMAEAMLFDLPVITTGHSGQVDFCTNETAWLIDYKFEEVQTHMGLFNSYWGNPSIEHLSQLMKELLSEKPENILKKTMRAKRNILTNHKWEDCTKRINNIVRAIQNKKSNEKVTNPKIGWTTTWNSRCGIATYSKFLINQFSDEVHVTIFSNKLPQSDIIDKFKELNTQRVWMNAVQTDLTEFYNAVVKSEIETLVIQFNFGFFNLYAFEKLIQKLHKNNIKVFIEFHSVSDVDKKDFKASLGWIKDTLRIVDKLLVHNIDDLNILKGFDLVENVTFFPHGVIESDVDEKVVIGKKRELGIKNKFIIASYGFLLPQKGIKELIEAFARVKDQNENMHLLLVNALYPTGESIVYAKECKELINKLALEDKVTMITDFLPDEESLAYLQCSDLIVMPYKETKESSSAAVRHALSAQKTILCTPQYIFNNVKDLIHFTKDETTDEIVNGILRLMNDNVLMQSKVDIQIKWIKEYSWFNMANRMASFLDVKQKKRQIQKNVTKQLKGKYFIDVTTLINNQNESVIHNMLKRIFEELKQVSVKIIPIYRDINNEYRVANKYFPQWCKLDLGINSIVPDIEKKDTYLSLVLDLECTSNDEYNLFIEDLKEKGILIEFMVYDIFPITNPESFDEDEIEMFSNWLDFIASKSNNILCISEFWKDRITDYVENNLGLDKKVNIINIDIEEDITKITKYFR